MWLPFFSALRILESTCQSRPLHLWKQLRFLLGRSRFCSSSRYTSSRRMINYYIDWHHGRKYILKQCPVTFKKMASCPHCNLHHDWATKSVDCMCNYRLMPLQLFLQVGLYQALEQAGYTKELCSDNRRFLKVMICKHWKTASLIPFSSVHCANISLLLQLCSWFSFLWAKLMPNWPLVK
jgi:hypothetical protein